MQGGSLENKHWATAMVNRVLFDESLVIFATPHDPGFLGDDVFVSPPPLCKLEARSKLGKTHQGS